MSETYNGYKNRETWAVALWIRNDEWLHYAILPMRHDYKGARLGRAIRDYFERLLHAALGDGDTAHARMILRDIGRFRLVDWTEVADSLTP